MPITVDTDPERDLTIFKATGLIEFEEVLYALKAFYNDEPTPNMLIDLTDLPTIQISSKQIHELAAFQPRFEGKRAPGKTAIFATAGLHLGMSKLFEDQNAIQGSPHAVRIFTSMDSAIFWLDEY